MSLQDCWEGVYSRGYIFPVSLLIVSYSDRRVSTRQPALSREGRDKHQMSISITLLYDQEYMHIVSLQKLEIKIFHKT